MKKKHVFRIITGVLIAVFFFFWHVFHFVPFVLDPECDMGDKYVIQSPGYVLYWEVYHSPEIPPELIIYPETVEQFLIKNPWLLGKTEKGWFAINKPTKQLHYPLKSKEELGPITGLDISSLVFETDFRPYLIVPEDLVAIRIKAQRVVMVLIILTAGLFFAGPYIAEKLKLVFPKIKSAI